MDDQDNIVALIATVADSGEAIHVGGEVSRESAAIELQIDKLPELLQNYIAQMKKPQKGVYLTLSLSLLLPKNAVSLSS